MKYTVGFLLGLALAFLAVRLLAERGVFYNVPDDGGTPAPHQA